MTRILSKIKSFDPILLISIVVISTIGLLSISSSTPHLFLRQFLFICVGFLIMILISFIDWRVLRDSPYLVFTLYIVSVLLLIGLFFFAPVIRDVRRWYSIGPILIGPGELVKLVLIILLAKYFSTRHVEMYKISHIVLSGLYVFIPALRLYFFSLILGQQQF